ncbi:MAG: heme lyase CcmF/NrfE family subunit [Chromatiales bacterium]|nr:heme lyase CcmF/NrfE family subunit [Chromatiales bacterium]
MIVELGHFLLVLALSTSLLLGVTALSGAHLQNTTLMAVARPASCALFILLLLSYLALSYAFATDDFSVLYVAGHSNTSLPIYYKLSAVWGGHEGSLLLWVFILGVWIFAVALLSRKLPDTFSVRVLGVMGLIITGFLLFTLATSNPFERLFPSPADGRDLNPLLQDPGLVIHPPMLYMGYVGFSVAFAFAIAVLLGGKFDAAWARWSRPWVLAAWVFLTIGITLGSWWAYHELGWGGWWFWDPVENASFMPWLVGTALIHSLAVTEKRNAFRSWTLLLAISAFSLSLLGTFLVRSGVLVSVHAFANDPERGVYILAFLAVVIGSALLLYIVRTPQIKSGGMFALVSREHMLLINNVLLVVAMTCILIATLYPLAMDVLGLDKISVGAPYFSAVFVPLTLPLVFLAGLGPKMQWQQASLSRLWQATRGIIGLALVIGVALLFVVGGDFSLPALIGIIAGVWIIVAMLSTLLESGKLSFLESTRWNRLRTLPASFYGMNIAHIGMGIFVLGVTFSGAYSEEKNALLAEGEALYLAGYHFVFNGVRDKEGVNYMALEGKLDVYKNDQQVATLYPQKRVYRVQKNPMTEAAIDATLLRDLYVSLAEPVGERFGVRVYYKPFIRWIWIGALLMAVGGLWSMSDRRYRRP